MPVLGQDFFPSVDAGQIRLHFRARTGLRIEETARLADQVDARHPPDDRARNSTTILDNIGLPYSGINLCYSNGGTIGTADAEILVQLRPTRTRLDGDVHQATAPGAAATGFPASSSSSSRRTSSRRF